MNSKPSLTYAEFIQKVKQTKPLKQKKPLNSLLKNQKPVQSILKDQKHRQRQLNNISPLGSNNRRLNSNDKQLNSTYKTKMQTQYTPQKNNQVNNKKKHQFISTMNIQYDESNRKTINNRQTYCLTERLGQLPSQCIQKINKKGVKQKENYQQCYAQRSKINQKNNNSKTMHNASQLKDNKINKIQNKNIKSNKNLLLKNIKNNSCTIEDISKPNKQGNEKAKIKANLNSNLYSQRSLDQFCNFNGNHQGQMSQRNVSYMEDQISQTNRGKSFSLLTQKSFQCVYNKFIHEIKQILTAITKKEVNKQLLNHRISYIEYLQTLKQMKMIQKDYQPYGSKSYSINQIDLVRQLWEQIVCGHNTNHLILVLGIILKIGAPNSMQNCLFLQQKYQSFRFTKLQLTRAKSYTQKDSISFYNYPFQPYVSKKSQQLASRSKSRQKKYKLEKPQKQNCNISFTQRQNASFNTQFDCTYALNQKSVCSPVHNKQFLSPLGNKRSQILYRNAKQKSKQKRMDKSTVDYEYQRNKKQLTFKPKVILKKKINQNQKIYESSKVSGQDKCINRIIRGRVQKQVKQITIEKGIPYNEKIIQKMIKTKYNQLVMAKTHGKKQREPSSCQLRIFEKGIKNIWDEGKMNSVNNQQQNKHKIPFLFQQFENSNSLQSFSESPIFKSPMNNYKNIHENYVQKLQIEKIQSKSKDFNDEVKNNSGRKQVYHHNQGQQEDINSFSTNQTNQNINIQDYLYLDIYLQEDRFEKLLIKKDSTLQELNLVAQQFIIKHSLSCQMQQKLKQSLMRALKFHNLQKIDEGAQFQEDASQIQITTQANNTFQQSQ